MITFITSNEKKISEARIIFPDIVGQQYELPEIQSVDLHEIIQFKLAHARSIATPPFIVDDTALYLDCLAGDDGVYGIPGPFIKWFLETIGNTGLVELAQKYNNTSATAVTAIGYMAADGSTMYAEGRMRGRLAIPDVINNKGWDAVFFPDGHDQPFAVLSSDIKRTIGQRSQALIHLHNELQLVTHDV